MHEPTRTVHSTCTGLDGDPKPVPPFYQCIADGLDSANSYHLVHSWAHRATCSHEPSIFQLFFIAIPSRQAQHRDAGLSEKQGPQHHCTHCVHGPRGPSHANCVSEPGLHRAGGVSQSTVQICICYKCYINTPLSAISNA